jgi:serine/threonine protein kinase, bacterial
MTDSLDDTYPLLANRYRVIRVLGEGGFGTTYLATDTQLPSQRKCVVKQLKPVKDNPEIHQLVLERFQREAAILESLGDGNDQIPSLYANFAEGDVFYLVEGWIEGDTLIQKLAKEGLLSENAVYKILTSLLQILSYIHQQKMVHRDIKPDNIILRWRDGKPVLIDFGAVKETMKTVISSQGQSSRSIVVGTPGFMPSEQVAGRPVYSSDLYGLGMTAIYLLTGKMPQDLKTDLETGQCIWQPWVSGLSAPFAAVLDRAIQSQPQARFTTAQEMLEALQSTANVPASVAGAVISPSQPIATAVSMPPEYAATVARIPSEQSFATQINLAPASSTTASGGEWKKAAIIGGLIGASILGAAAIVAQQLPRALEAAKDKDTKAVSKDAKATPKPAAKSKLAAIAKTPVPAIAIPPGEAIPDSAPPPSSPTNATVMGESGSKYIRTGVGTQYGVAGTAYPGDRVQVLNSAYNRDGFLWYEVYTPKTGTQGWMASHLVDRDGQAPAPAPRAAAPAPPPAARSADADTNAIIVGAGGSKNIRTGPGTDYPVSDTAYPGDRIRIIASGSDRGGYPWYKVYCPKSGAKGWIGAQLVDTALD